jgi:glycosyltransferase involved in cell wall biosynthesis
MRLLLFTDTLADVNGVSRFLQNLAAWSEVHAPGVRIITSTRRPMPPRANVVNLPPRFARRLPLYPDLDLAVPPLGAMLAAARGFGPDVIHVSTPGPVGVAGVVAAARGRLPLVGVYHTDFPAYVERLARHESLAAMAEWTMGTVYRRFRRVLVRNDDDARRVVSLGVSGDRVARLRAGIDLAAFGPEKRDEPRLGAMGLEPGTLRVLYVGRVSAEKNLGFLAEVWRAAAPRLASAGLRPRLVVVGDGPYRAEFERRLEGTPATFTGFRFGADLAALYASSDLFVFPSDTDTLGQVVIEAQASGVPALVSDRGGPATLVVDGRTGRVLPAGDAGAWVAALVALGADTARRRAMTTAAHTHARRFGLDACLREFMDHHRAAAGLPLEDELVGEHAGVAVDGEGGPHLQPRGLPVPGGFPLPREPLRDPAVGQQREAVGARGGVEA